MRAEIDEKRQLLLTFSALHRSVYSILPTHIHVGFIEQIPSRKYTDSSEKRGLAWKTHFRLTRHNQHKDNEPTLKSVLPIGMKD